MPNSPGRRPEIRFVGGSTDAEKIRFFGNLMPALLLLKEAPLQFVIYSVKSQFVPHAAVPDFIAAQADDVARLGDTLIFEHGWQTGNFDPRVFGRAKLFLTQLGCLVRWAGYTAERLDPLSPSINLPRLAAAAPPAWHAIRQCPPKPQVSGVIDLRQCIACGICLTVCPIGKAAQA